MFTPKLLELIKHSEAGGSLSRYEVDVLIKESLQIFRWHARTPVSITDYHALQREHAVVADIVCFPCAHINHLIPRTLHIDLVQHKKFERGLPAKVRIEGPPGRMCAILLRQISFKALLEDVDFEEPNGDVKRGIH